MNELRKSRNGSVPSSGTRGSKDDSECASLRIGRLPKPEAVKTLPVESDNADCYKAMEAQNNGNVVLVSNSREESIAAGRSAINKRAVGGKK